MGEYVDIGGVNTWYDEAGSGEPLVLLHGGVCAPMRRGRRRRRFFVNVFASSHRNGGDMVTRLTSPRPLTYDAMAADTVGFRRRDRRWACAPGRLDRWRDRRTCWSQSRVRTLVRSGRDRLELRHGGHVPEFEDIFVGMAPDSDDVAMFRGLYEMHSPDGPEHWPVVFAKFVEMTQRGRTSQSATSPACRRPRSWSWAIDDWFHRARRRVIHGHPNSDAVAPSSDLTRSDRVPELRAPHVLDCLEDEPVPTIVLVRRRRARCAISVRARRSADGEAMHVRHCGLALGDGRSADRVLDYASRRRRRTPDGVPPPDVTTAVCAFATWRSPASWRSCAMAS